MEALDLSGIQARAKRAALADPTDLAREALEEIASHMGAALKHLPYIPGFDPVVAEHIEATHGLAQRAIRRLNECPVTLAGGRAL